MNLLAQKTIKLITYGIVIAAGFVVALITNHDAKSAKADAGDTLGSLFGDTVYADAPDRDVDSNDDGGGDSNDDSGDDG